MTTLTLIVQWCHIVAALLWAGGAATLDFVVTPILDRLPDEQARPVGSRLVGRATVFFSVTAGAAITFGVLRGTVFGPIRSVEALGSPYGVTWCAALVLAVALAFVGTFGVGRAAEDFYAGPSRRGASGRPSSMDRSVAQRRLRLWSRVQLVGFGVILVGMVLMAEVFG